MLKYWFEVIRNCEIPFHRFVAILIFVFLILGLDLITLSSIPIFFAEENSFQFPLLESELAADKTLVFAVILISFMLRTLLSFFFQVIVIKFGVDLQLSLRERLLRKKLEAGYHEDYRDNLSSDFIFGLQVVPTSIANLLIQFFQACGEAFIGIGLIIFIASISSDLFVSFFFGFGLIGLFYLTVFKRITKEAGKIENAMVSRMLLQLKEVHHGINDIKQFRAQNYFFERLQDAFRRLAGSIVTIRVISSGTRYVLELGFVVVLFFFFFVLDGLKTGEAFLIELGVFTVAGYRLVPGFRSVIAMYVQLNNHQNTAERFLELMQRRSETSKSPLSGSLDDENGNFKFESLELRRISFGYNEGVDLFKDLDLQIVRGDFVAILGPSGAGKTTLIDIISGRLPTRSGTIHVNESLIDQTVFNGITSYMSQAPFVFSGTVEENICLTNNRDLINQDLFGKALALANIDFLGKGHEQLKKILNEDGSNFSSGQIQRICLARAVYFRKQILIIDEGTSKLDQKNRDEIYSALVALTRSGVTILMVTHDAEVLRYSKRTIDLAQFGK